MRRPKDMIQTGMSIVERARTAVTEKSFTARVLDVADRPIKAGGFQEYTLVKLQGESGSRQKLTVAIISSPSSPLKSGDRVECTLYRGPNLKVRGTRFASIFPLD